MTQTVKKLPAVQETQVQFLGWEDPLEKRMATHSSILDGEFHGQRRLTDPFHQFLTVKCNSENIN